MELRFKEDGHKYETIKDPTYKWISATTLIKHFHESFDEIKISEKMSKKKKSKWYKIPPEKIREIWHKEALRASSTGTWYHEQRENEVSSCDTLRRNGIDLPIYRPIIQDSYRISSPQQLSPGIYPELFVYLKSAGVCGQADRVEIIDDIVNVYDYKTNKVMKTQAYVSWDGVVKTMYPPISHIHDCDLMHYAIQLSIYMYIILKHNPNLKAGKMVLQHVTFEIKSEDQFGFPTLKLDNDNNPIIKEVVPYEVPFLKKEVENMFKYLKNHPKLRNQ